MAEVRSSAAFLAAFLLPVVAMCSQIFYRPLEEVLTKDMLVFEAKLTAVRNESANDETSFEYDFAHVKPLQGDTGAVKRGTYRMRAPVFRDAAGNIVGHFSPIVAASGHETTAKKGETVFVFTNLKADADGSIDVIRLEPKANEKAVEKLLSR